MRRTPVLLAILDGLALREEDYGNAVKQANKPNLDGYLKQYPNTTLTACGQAVGLPDGQMGNSEVGHLNIGAGRIVYQDLTRISRSIEAGDFFRNPALLNAMRQEKAKIHVMGLLSDGGVHSHIDHLIALLKLAASYSGIEVYLHLFLDGRDVAPNMAISYLDIIEENMKALGIGQIATIQGRYYAMDRDQRWDRIEKGYRAMVYGEGKPSLDARHTIKEFYEQEIYDEFIPPIVIMSTQNQPITTIENEDTVIFYNFRPDRAIQLSQALTQTDFPFFERGMKHPSSLTFVGMTHYSDRIEGEIAFSPQTLPHTLGAVLSDHQLQQLRIAETEKYPHVTYFLNGGREEPYAGEDRILIDSPKVATYDLKPEMSAYEVTDALLETLQNQSHDVIILNFANPDMVGHSGKLQPTIQAIEVVDACLGRIVDEVLSQDGTVLITADHGNADMVLTEDGQPHTAHTTYPVPFIVTDPALSLRNDGILADIAPTLLDLLQICPPEEMTGKTLIRRK